MKWGTGGCGSFDHPDGIVIIHRTSIKGPGSPSPANGAVSGSAYVKSKNSSDPGQVHVKEERGEKENAGRSKGLR